MSESLEQKAPPPPPVERIDSLQYIRVLLEQAVSRCNLLTVSDQSNQQSAISTLLRIDGEGQTFTLDKPYRTDKTAEELVFSKSDVINLTGKSRGASLSFKAEFKNEIEEEGLSLYRFSFPKEVTYSAQRASHRVNTRDFDTLISFTSSSGYVFDAPLCDISDGGLRVRAGRDIIKSITKGDHIYCTLDIDDESCKKLEVKLCKPSKTDDPNMIEFGAIFVDLLPHQKTLMSQYIAGLERMALRRQHDIPEAMPLFEATVKDVAPTEAEEL